LRVSNPFDGGPIGGVKTEIDTTIRFGRRPVDLL